MSIKVARHVGITTKKASLTSVVSSLQIAQRLYEESILLAPYPWPPSRFGVFLKTWERKVLYVSSRRCFALMTPLGRGSVWGGRGFRDGEVNWLRGSERGLCCAYLHCLGGGGSECGHVRGMFLGQGCLRLGREAGWVGVGRAERVAWPIPHKWRKHGVIQMPECMWGRSAHFLPEPCREDQWFMPRPTPMRPPFKLWLQ